MRPRILVVALAVLVLGTSVWAQDKTPVPSLVTVRTHGLGPERLSNLTPLVAPNDNPQTSEKVLLGKMLYFDTRLSKDNTISCATCHNPAMGWSDEGPTSEGIAAQRGGRRAPPVSNAAYSPLQFWDGRAPSLEEQAKGPIQNPIEMGNTHDAMLRSVNDIPGYVERFRNVFGATAMTIDQVAQAIAAYERTIVTTDSPFDRFVRGDEGALTALERKGLEIYNGKGHCSACHWGGYFSDGRFHNLGVAPANNQEPDEGRYTVTKNPADLGAFKTPTVRDVARRAPYMHNGSEKDLTAVVELYNRGGGPEDRHLDRVMVPLGLSQHEIEALVAFMTRAMNSTNPAVADEKPLTPSELPQ